MLSCLRWPRGLSALEQSLLTVLEQWALWVIRLCCIPECCCCRIIAVGDPSVLELWDSILVFGAAGARGGWIGERDPCWSPGRCK